MNQVRQVIAVNEPDISQKSHFAENFFFQLFDEAVMDYFPGLNFDQKERTTS